MRLKAKPSLSVAHLKKVGKTKTGMASIRRYLLIERYVQNADFIICARAQNKTLGRYFFSFFIGEPGSIERIQAIE